MEKSRAHIAPHSKPMRTFVGPTTGLHAIISQIVRAHDLGLPEKTIADHAKGLGRVMQVPPQQPLETRAFIELLRELRVSHRASGRVRMSAQVARLARPHPEF